ncbi:ribokinase [Jannaschia sp. LMIT008]|uniref:ribokinase n=1 Tax=Jannaschia maritima TaxID=3032585 RepID=UPI002810C475|nr:ribokinase [Jannaschia sp. LMIT008]
MTGGPVITVVGSFAVGLTMRAPKLPVFGETMFGREFDMGPGGKGSNQAVAAARLGADAALVAVVGRDQLAEVGHALWRADGVDATHVRVDDARATGAGFIILNEAGDNFILLDMGANEAMDAARVDAAEDRIARSDVVATVLEIPMAAAARAMALGRRHGARTILNPAPAAPVPADVLPNVDYMTPNESELRILLGLRPDDPRSSRELARELRARGVSNVVVTLGGRGALVLTEEGETTVEALPLSPVDTTGAGDAFNAGFATALAEGRPLMDAVRMGVACGGHACTALGVIPALPDRAQADAFLSNVPQPRRSR